MCIHNHKSKQMKKDSRQMASLFIATCSMTLTPYSIERFKDKQNADIVFSMFTDSPHLL